MLNPVKGDVPFEVGGEHYVLRLGINSLIALEAELGRGMDEIEVELATAPRMETIRAILWAGMLKHHPSTTIEQAGDIFDELGGAAAGQLIVQARAAMLPDAPKEAPGRKPRPRKAATGTGSNG